MASMRDIKRRRTSISSTQQITKAMKLVATVKLQKAKSHAENVAPYFEYMYSTVCSMLAKTKNIEHPYLTVKEGGKKAVIVITSNRGLAGGYNSNVVKLVTGDERFDKDNTELFCIGHKGIEALKHRGYNISDDESDVMEAPVYTDAARITRVLLNRYAEGEINEIYLCYTHFKNTVVHTPTCLKLLPVEIDPEEAEKQAKSNVLMIFEPNPEEAIGMIIPKYVTSLLYGALIEAAASENGARMQAMDSATSNAEEMIDDLTLKYNRARQGSITQELTEIIAGAEAIS
ncbi:MAG: ATP synthase F1 subunit gamma [Lachnospiraceae bacterium]|nr:ATP synthase F1 subunit gamma [Lachnospiraceae bacterium]